MKKELIRPLEKMPPRIKLSYCQLLSLMILVDNQINQLKMADLYRLIATIKLSSEKRSQLIEFIFSPDIKNLNNLIAAVNRELSLQEKNILRFSLMKDLIIIKDADFSESREEVVLLDKMKNEFKITDEQMHIIIEETKNDKVPYNENHKKKNTYKNFLAAGTGLGIPAAALYFSGTFRGLGALGLVTGLISLGGLKNKRKSFINGLLISILLGLTSYHTSKWLINYNSRNEKALLKLYKEKMEGIQKRAEAYILMDIQAIEDKIQSNEDVDLLIRLQEIKEVLTRTKGTLENTKAKHLL